MIAVEAFDILAYFSCPVVDHASRATVASRFIGQFPGENRRTAFVPVDQELDVVFVDLLALGIRVPTSSVAAKSVGVGFYASQIRPVLH